MRELTGEIVIPSDAPIIKRTVMLIEIRDVSRADALSIIVSQTRVTEIDIHPGDRIPFFLSIPEVPLAQSLDLRIHISCSGSGDIKTGDFLTTRSYPVPSQGNLGHISVFVVRI